MLKRVHDKKKCVIPNLFRNLDIGNDKELIAFVLVTSNQGSVSSRQQAGLGQNILGINFLAPLLTP